MKVPIVSLFCVFGIVLSMNAEPKPAKPEPPKITHENLYQMEELVKQGADPNAHYFLYPGLPWGDKIYPLYAAIRTGDSRLVKRLIALGAKPRGNQLNDAAWIKHPGMMKLLLKAGADPNGLKNNPPLVTAGFRGSVWMTELLLAQPNIEINKRDIDGQTALLCAASRGHAKVVEILLKAGADPNIKNKRGETPADKARQHLEKAKGMMKLFDKSEE